MTANRHIRLTKPSRAGLSACVSQAGRRMMKNHPCLAKAGQVLQGGGFVNTLKYNII